MRVLVTGATGYLGSWAARELARRGHHVRILVRATSKLDLVSDVPAERTVGDITDPASVRRALEGCEGVIHAAGLARLRDRDRAHLVEVNRDGAVNVLGAALDAGLKRAVFLSSAGAMGGSRTPVAMDESWESTAESVGVDYLVSKLLGERAAVEIGRRGLPLVVLRPGVVLGPGDALGSSAGIVLRIARGSLPAVVRGGGSYCDVRDVATAQVEALERGRAGEVYVLGGYNLEMTELAKRVAELAGVRPPRRLPYPAMLAFGWANEVASALQRKRAAVSRQLVRGARRYTYLSSEKARRQLGYVNRPFDETLRDTLRWFIEHGDLEPRTPQLRQLTAIK